MKLIKIPALFYLIFLFILGISSCEKDSETQKITDFEKKDIVMNGAQENPAVPSSATGSMDVFYSKETRTLSYTVRWSGLTDSLAQMHIHGLAPIGFNAGIVQNIVATSNTIFLQKTAGKFTFGKSGTLSGTLLADGVLIKEQDILNGVFYINIHTATYPGGEIRGQIRFD